MPRGPAGQDKGHGLVRAGFRVVLEADWTSGWWQPSCKKVYFEVVGSGSVELIGLLHFYTADLHEFEHILSMLNLDEIDVHELFRYVML